MNDQLKALAKPVSAFDGQVTFHMIPYRTVQLGIVLRDVAQHRGVDLASAEHMEGEDVLFACVDSSTIGIDFALTDKSPAYLRGLEAYWQSRNGKVLENLDRFNMLLAPPVRDAWWQAYEDTRDTTGE